MTPVWRCASYVVRGARVFTIVSDMQQRSHAMTSLATWSSLMALTALMTLALPAWTEVVIINPGLDGDVAADLDVVSDRPGRAEPVGLPEPLAVTVEWANRRYTTHIVIEPGTGERRRALVATFERATRDLEVFYSGRAFVDADGRIHVDCRRAETLGPSGPHWSPDSFAWGDAGPVGVIDDANRTNTGQLVARTPAFTDDDPSTLQPEYRAMRMMLLVIVEGYL